MFVSTAAVCSGCENLDWVFIYRESLKFEYEVVAKAWSCRESLYVINVAFGYEKKNNPARRAG